jgi:hypothetical protein
MDRAGGRLTEAGGCEVTVRWRGEEGVRVRALGAPMAGRETEACLPVSSTGVETERAAAEVTRRTRTAGRTRRRFLRGGGMAAAADLGILDGEAGGGEREGKNGMGL